MIRKRVQRAGWEPGLGPPRVRAGANQPRMFGADGLRDAVRVGAADLAVLQRTAGNRAVSGLMADNDLGRAPWAPGTLPGKSGSPMLLDVGSDPVVRLAEYLAAVASGDWARAALALSRLSDQEITDQVAVLTHEQVEAMHKACPAGAYRVGAPLLDRQFRKAIADWRWTKAAIYLNQFNEADLRAHLNSLTHDQRAEIFFGARAGLTGPSQQRITDLIGSMGTFSNEIEQHMTEGVTTTVTGAFTWALIENELRVYVPVDIRPDPGIAAPIKVWQDQIDKVWNQFAVVEPGGIKIPIVMKMWHLFGSGPTVRVVQNVVPGSYGCTANGAQCDRADAGKWYPAMPDDVAPHEFGHLIGLPDEYERSHDDYRNITSSDKKGPPNSSGRKPKDIATDLHTALNLPDDKKRAAAATKVLVNCGLIAGGVPQQGDFAQDVQQAYDAQKFGDKDAPQSLLYALQHNIALYQAYTILTVFSYTSTTVMGDPDVFGVPHTHPVEPRHLREFLKIVKQLLPRFSWSIGPR